MPQLPQNYPANTKNKAVPSMISAPAVINGTVPPLDFDVSGMIVNGRNSPQKTSESARAFVGRAPWPNCVRRRFLCRYFRAIDESPMPRRNCTTTSAGGSGYAMAPLFFVGARFIMLKANSTVGHGMPRA